MRLKFVHDDGHKSVEVVEYDFRHGTPPSVTYTRKDGVITSAEVTGDVFVTNERGETIDKLKQGRK